MAGLSLNPRRDLFHFEFPKEFLPPLIQDKYNKILRRDPAVIADAIQYLNESIVGVTLPSIQDIVQVQNMQSRNYNDETSHYSTDVQKEVKSLGKIRVEPMKEESTYNAANPLKSIGNKITVTFRMNQGMLNYWMIYETILFCITKPNLYHGPTSLHVDILTEDNQVGSRVYLKDPHINGIDGVDFSFTGVNNSSTQSFNMEIIYNNIDFNLIDFPGNTWVS